MKQLYPEIEPFDSGMLKVSDIHEIYYERVGNPDGVPVVFLPGGPGGGLIPSYRRFFGTNALPGVLFHQTALGQPTGGLDGATSRRDQPVHVAARRQRRVRAVADQHDAGEDI